MRAFIALTLLCAGFVSPAFADKKLDPDPGFLAKARTAATATVEPHYDLVSEKVPFWARFMICAGQLAAARDEGRALPIPKDEVDRLIADYRARATELQAYRQKNDAKAPALDVDAEVVKIRAGAMEFLPGDVTKLGVETMKKRHAERIAFCQLTRDWYEVQNGLRQAASATDQQKLTAVHDQAMKKIAAEAPKPPMPPAISPRTIAPALKPATAQPAASAPGNIPPVRAIPVAVPIPGTPVGGDNPRDARVGADLPDADARKEFSGRPLWSALAECSARMDLIQKYTGDSTRQQSDSYASRAAYVLWGNRGDVGGKDLPAMAGPVAQERARLAARVAASWDEHRQRTGQLPHANWGQVCWRLDQYALAYGNRLHAAKKQQADREYAEAMKRFNETSSSSSGSSSGGYSGVSSNSSLDAAAAASRAEHQRNMDQYKRDTDRIRQEIRTIDRKYR